MQTIILTISFPSLLFPFLSFLSTQQNQRGKKRRLEAESLRGSAPKQFSPFGGNSAPQKPPGIAGVQAESLRSNAPKQFSLKYAILSP